jgi:hypothetical protein
VRHYPGFTHSVTPDTHPGGAVGAGLPDPVVDCTDCHDGPKHHNAAGAEEGAWKFTAPPNMEWAGLGEEEVCIMQAAEARLKNRAAGGESATTKDSYLHHVTTDPLIEQAFHGRAGGARDANDPDLPKPPLSYGDFKAGAQAWIDAGAPCRATGSLSHYEENDAAYEHPAPAGKIAVEQPPCRRIGNGDDHGERLECAGADARSPWLHNRDYEQQQLGTHRPGTGIRHPRVRGEAR